VKDDKSELERAASCSARIMTLCVSMCMQVVTPTILTGESLLWPRGQDRTLGAGWFHVLSLYKFAGQAEVQQHRVADMLGGAGRDRP